MPRITIFRIKLFINILYFLQSIGSIDLIDAIYYYNALFASIDPIDLIDAIYYYNALFASIDSIDLINAI